MVCVIIMGSVNEHSSVHKAVLSLNIFCLCGSPNFFIILVHSTWRSIGIAIRGVSVFGFSVCLSVLFMFSVIFLLTF